MTARGDGPEIVVDFDGTADQYTSDQLTDFLAKVHVDALAANAEAVVVRRLEFMNSSSFTSLVMWVSSIHDLEPEKRYKIRVQSNRAIPWQKRSLQSLTCFAVDVVTVEYPSPS